MTKQYVLTGQIATEPVTFTFEANELEPNGAMLEGVVRITTTDPKVYSLFKGAFHVTLKPQFRFAFIQGTREDFAADETLLAHRAGAFNEDFELDSYSLEQSEPIICSIKTYDPHHKKLSCNRVGLFKKGKLLEGEETKYPHALETSDFKELYYKGKKLIDNRGCATVRGDACLYHDEEGILVGIKCDGSMLITTGLEYGRASKLQLSVTTKNGEIATVAVKTSLYAAIWTARLCEKNHFKIQSPYADLLNPEAIKVALMPVLHLLSERALIQPLDMQMLSIEIDEPASPNGLLFSEEGTATLVSGQLSGLGLLEGPAQVDINLGLERQLTLKGAFRFHEFVSGEVLIRYPNNHNRVITVPKDIDQLAREVILKDGHEVTTLFSMKGLGWRDVLSDIPEGVFITQDVVSKRDRHVISYRGFMKNGQYHGEGTQTITRFEGETKIEKQGTGRFDNGLLCQGGKVTITTTDAMKQQTVLLTLESQPVRVEGIAQFEGSEKKTVTFNNSERIVTETKRGGYAEGILIQGEVVRTFNDTKIIVTEKGCFEELQYPETAIREGERAFSDGPGVIAIQQGQFTNGMFSSGRYTRFYGPITEYYCGRVARAEQSLFSEAMLNVVFHDPQGIAIKDNKVTASLTWQKNFRESRPQGLLYQVTYHRQTRQLVKVTLPGEWMITCEDEGFQALKKVKPKDKIAFENQARDSVHEISATLVNLALITPTVISVEALLAEEAKEKRTFNADRQDRKNAALQKERDAQKKQRENQAAKVRERAQRKRAEEQERLARIAAQQAHERAVHRKRTSVAELSANLETLDPADKPQEDGSGADKPREDGSRKNRAQEDSSGNNSVTDSMLQQHEYTKSAQSKADHTEKRQYVNAQGLFAYEFEDYTKVTDLYFNCLVVADRPLVKGKLFSGTAVFTINTSQAAISYFRLEGTLRCIANWEESRFQKPYVQIETGTLIKLHDETTSTMRYEEGHLVPERSSTASHRYGFFNVAHGGQARADNCTTVVNGPK